MIRPAPEAYSFVAKWLAQEPEMEPVLGFVPAVERDLAAHWGALQNELFEAMVEPRDSGVAQVKLAWWGETLVRGAGQGAAHPLVRGLFAHPAAVRVPAADWQALVHSALRLGAEDASPTDLASALQVRRDYAAAIARIDAGLFGTTEGSDTGRAIAVGLLVRQLRTALRGRRARHPFLPLQLFARHGQRAAEFDLREADVAGQALIGDFATSLAAELGTGWVQSLTRRCRIALDRRLLQGIAKRPLPSSAMLSHWAALWTAWRAARAGRPALG